MRDNKSKRLIVFLILSLFSLPAFSFESNLLKIEKISLSAERVIKPDFLKKLEVVKEEEKLKVLVELKDKVDLSPFKAVKGKRTLHARTILKNLRETARISQDPFLKYLKELQRKGKKNKRIFKFQSFWLVNMVALEATKSIVFEIAEKADIFGVKAIYEDQIVYPPEPVNPEESAGSSSDDLTVLLEDGTYTTWGIDKIGAHKLWKDGISGEGVIVGCLDSGVDTTHPALAGKMATTGNGSLGWYDALFGQASPIDIMGHGTLSIGIMVGGYDTVDNIHIGVAPGAKYYMARIFGGGEDENTSYDSIFLDAAQWMTDPDNNPDTNDFPSVINNSWHKGNSTTDEWFRSGVQAWAAMGIMPVYSAGNKGPSSSTVWPPSGYPESFSVGATDQNDEIASFSSRGPTYFDGIYIIKPCLSAPGVDVISALSKDSDYTPYGVDKDLTVKNGTSLSAPHVAGTVALILSAYPNLTIEEIEAHLTSSAVDLNITGKDNDSGWGRLDAYRSIVNIVNIFKRSEIKNLTEINKNNYFNITNTGNIININNVITRNKSPYPDFGISYSIDDSLGNNDGIIDRLETIKLTVALTNIGAGNALGVSGILTSADPNRVSINSSEANFGNILSQESSTNENSPFIFMLNSDYIAGRDLLFYLKISTTNGYILNHELTFKTPLPFPYQSGTWPINLTTAEIKWPLTASDLNQDGKLEIIFVSKNGYLYVINHEGEVILQTANFGTWVNLPSIGNLDEDPEQEIIFGVGEPSSSSTKGKNYALNIDGLFVIAWEGVETPTSFPYTLAADLNYDGILEVITIDNYSENGNLSVYNNQGASIGEVSFKGGKGMGLYPWNQLPALGNLDNNKENGQEIVISTSDGLFAFRFNFSSQTFESWKIADGQIYPVTLGDLDQNGDLEVIYDNAIYHHDGSKYSNSITSLGPQYGTETILGDINQDNKLEIVSVFMDEIHVLNPEDGTEMSGFPRYSIELPRSSPLLADIDGDNLLEIILVTSNSDDHLIIEAYNHDGTTVEDWPLQIYTDHLKGCSIIVKDLDADNDIEIIIQASDSDGTSFFVLDLPGKYDSRYMDWPMFRHDPAHSGAYSKESSVSSLSISAQQNSQAPSIRFVDKVSGDIISSSPILKAKVENRGTIDPESIKLEISSENVSLYIIPTSALDAKSGDITLDILARAGSPLPDGKYTFTLKVSDTKGNEGSASISLQVRSGFEISNVVNYPNPFGNEGTNFSFQLSKASSINIKVFNTLGELVKRIETTGAEGFNSISWDGKNEANELLANGAYLYIINATDSSGNVLKAKGKLAVLR